MRHPGYGVGKSSIRFFRDQLQQCSLKLDEVVDAFFHQDAMHCRDIDIVVDLILDAGRWHLVNGSRELQSATCNRLVGFRRI